MTANQNFRFNFNTAHSFQWAVFFLALLLAVASGSLSRYLRNEAGTTNVPMEAQRRFILPTSVFKFLSFGHEQAAVDFLFLRFLTDPAYRHIQGGEHPSHYYDLELATRIDPYFYGLYSSGGRLLSVIRDDDRGAEEIVLRGVEVQKKLDETPLGPKFDDRFWDQKWKLPFLLGYIELFEIQNLNRAAEAYGSAAREAGAPPFLASLSERLSSVSGRVEVGMRVLNQMAVGAEDISTQRKIEKQKKDLYLLGFLVELRQKFHEYVHNRKEFRGKLKIEKDKLERVFLEFSKRERLDGFDPFGGKVFLDPKGVIQSTTPHDKIMGLE